MHSPPRSAWPESKPEDFSPHERHSQRISNEDCFGKEKGRLEMSEENKAVVHSAYAAINAGDLDALAAVIAEDLVEHDVVPGMPPTKAGVIQFFTSMRKSFSGLTLTVHDMISEGDKVFARATMTGTNVGEFMGMPATNKQINVPIADYFRFESGKVVEHWGVTDTGIMKDQLGAS